MSWDSEPVAIVFSKLTDEVFYLGPDGFRYSSQDYAQIVQDEVNAGDERVCH